MYNLLFAVIISWHTRRFTLGRACRYGNNSVNYEVNSVL